MLIFISKRLLLAIPTILIVIGINFVLYRLSPGDPVEATYTMPERRSNAADSIAYEQQYQIYYRELGLDKPLFFCSLTAKRGLEWHGMDNQYWHKVKAVAVGDFGIASQTKQPVTKVLFEAIRWTLILNFLAYSLILGLGVYLGLKSASHYQQLWDKRLMRFTFLLDAIPLFWFATIVLIFFTNKQYGMKIFPNPRFDDVPMSASFFIKLMYALPHMIAPVLCIVLSGISLIIRQMRASALNVKKQQFIITAAAKGLNEKNISRKHIFPNAIFPIITYLGTILPMLIAGSLVIENIFSIPGMGKLSIEAINNKDFPVLFGIVLLTAMLTVIGNILSDILYRRLDPRVMSSAHH